MCSFRKCYIYVYPNIQPIFESNDKVNYYILKRKIKIANKDNFVIFPGTLEKVQIFLNIGKHSISFVKNYP